MYLWFVFVAPNDKHPLWPNHEGNIQSGYVGKKTKKEALAQYEDNPYWKILAVKRIKI